MRSSIRLAALSAATLLASSAASAQLGGVNPVSFGISGGAAIPTGDFGDAFKTGYSVDGILTIKPPVLPVSFRGEVGYTRFDAKDFDGADVRAHTRFISGVANLVYTFPSPATSVIRPYLIGGVGIYNGRIADDDDDAHFNLGTKVGLNGGVGLEVPLTGITVFGEARYTSVFTDNSHANYIPLRVGIRF